MENLVALRSVYKKYDNKTVLQDVSFELQPGQITTLIGQNGSGKTTIAKIILGSEKINSGSVFVKQGVKIGYVPQKLDLNFNLPMSSINLIELIAGRKIGENDEELSFIKNFATIQDRDISSLSGGQLQKLVLIGTVMSKPDLLILDEPTHFLDVASQRNFYSLIAKLKEERKITVFMISHDLFTVMKSSDQVICLNRHICCSGKPSDIDDNEDFKNALSEIGVYVHNHDHNH